MELPRLIITGASGFIGRHLLEYFKDEFNIVGLARRSQLHCGAPIHNNITWYQVDIGDRESLASAFQYIRESGGADYVIHLAAHYDFTGDDNPEYWRTNVEGMRNVLEECRNLDLKRLVFSSSVAACAFPDHGDFLTEKNPPDGDHIYAVTKRIGEEMLAEYDEHSVLHHSARSTLFRLVRVRAALYLPRNVVVGGLEQDRDRRARHDGDPLYARP